MQNGFQILDHPSDLGIEAYGDTLKEAFCEAGKGLLSIILDLPESAPIELRTIRLHGADSTQLLLQWLSEILYLFDGEHFVGTELSIESLTETDLLGSARGINFVPGSHPTKLDVKAVTYHNIEIGRRDGGVIIRVFLDI